MAQHRYSAVLLFNTTHPETIIQNCFKKSSNRKGPHEMCGPRILPREWREQFVKVAECPVIAPVCSGLQYRQDFKDLWNVHGDPGRVTTRTRSHPLLSMHALVNQHAYMRRTLHDLQKQNT